MKRIIRISCLVILAILVAECSAPPRALITLNRDKEGISEKENQRRSKGKPEPILESSFELGYKSILDQETSLRWEPYFDNPSSMYRFIMGEQSPGKRLPRIYELTSFFDKVARELTQDEGGELSAQIWLQQDGDYITSSEIITPENKKLYQGIRWNHNSKNYEVINLASGDLVYLLLISQQ